ncbi:hypothetical protein [Actinoplanes sp. NPDC020271]|uniref:hypothetical protein n=1 Tax=Actinoplanes sp. NPDC020271 TaxID=3363896 RepID=UPI0037B4CB59
MTLFYIAVYHNNDSRFFPYEPGHTLTKVISHWRHFPDQTSLEDVGEWAYRVFNDDLDSLQGRRGYPDRGGELDFLLACTYRLLKLRSLSAGDVLGITTEQNTTFLACEFNGWRVIPIPSNRSGKGLTAEAIYQHLRKGRRG